MKTFCIILLTLIVLRWDLTARLICAVIQRRKAVRELRREKAIQAGLDAARIFYLEDFTGWIRQFEVFDRALTADEIQQLYERGVRTCGRS